MIRSNLTFAILATIVLASSLPVLSQMGQQQTQLSAVEIDQETLSQPYWLRVGGSRVRQLRLEISLNGRVIQSLENRQTALNLSPYLKPGKQTLLVTGQYAPREAEIVTELKGQQIQISQQSTGSGLLNQIFIVKVR